MIRVVLCDFDTKIATRALPTFKVSDVLAIVYCQINNRKLQLPIKGTYSLFSNRLNKWMIESKKINEYVNTSIMVG